MAYITDILKGTIEPLPDRISLEHYVQESAFVTRYLSRVVKDKALVVYQVLFHLSWFETGKGEIIVPWARVGSFIRSEQGNIIDNHTTVKRRLPDLFEHKCIAVNRQRGNANEISVHLPSDIPACRELIDQEEREARVEPLTKDERDYYTDPGRRLVVLARDRHACVYCTTALTEENFVLDHLVPVAKGGRIGSITSLLHVTSATDDAAIPIQSSFYGRTTASSSFRKKSFSGKKTMSKHSLRKALANNRMYSDSKKRRSFVALLFAAGDAKRYAPLDRVHLP